MVNIARKNLLHDPVKFAITLLGVTFSVALIATQVGMYLGFMRNASMLIDHTPADLWITSKNCRNFDFSLPFDRRRIYRVRGAKGVAWADPLTLTWGVMKAQDGGTEQVEIIGFNPATGIGGPWAMKEGAVIAETRHFEGNRESVRRQSVIAALQGVLECLEG